MSESRDYLGRGIYSIPEAATLTSLPANQVRRWILGYGGIRADIPPKYAPLFAADYPRMGRSVSISFLDLVEVLFIRSFRKHGVSWGSIRVASQKAAAFLESPHPFARRAFYTDGRDILTRVAQDSGERELINLVRDQYEMDDIVSPALYENLEFGDMDFANRWWPLGRSQGVVVDPALNLGKPVVAAYNIPTATLGRMAKTAGNVRQVAEWYEVDEATVLAAIEYENAIAA